MFSFREDKSVSPAKKVLSFSFDHFQFEVPREMLAPVATSKDQWVIRFSAAPQHMDTSTTYDFNLVKKSVIDRETGQPVEAPMADQLGDVLLHVRNYSPH